MIVGVVAKFAFKLDFAFNIVRMIGGIFANHKECCARIVFFQNIKNSVWRIVISRSVIKCERNHRLWFIDNKRVGNFDCFNCAPSTVYKSLTILDIRSYSDRIISLFLELFNNFGSCWFSRCVNAFSFWKIALCALGILQFITACLWTFTPLGG